MMLCNTSYMAMSKWYWNSSNSLRLHGDVVLSSGLSIAVRDQVSALRNMRASELCMPETLASQQWQVATFHLWFVSRANIQLAIQTQPWKTKCHCSFFAALKYACNQLQTTTLGRVSESVDPRWFQGGCSLRHGSGAKLKTKSCWTNFHWLTLGCQNGFQWLCPTKL